MPDPIRSPNNPLIVDVARLHRARERRRRRQTIIEGLHALELAVAAGAQIGVVLVDEQDSAVVPPDLDPIVVSPAALRRAADTESPRGPVAVVSIPEPGALVAADTLVLVDLADPGNAGTLLRTAAAFGMQLAVSERSVDMWSPKVLRAGAGAHWAVPPRSIEGLADLRRAGMLVVASVSDGGDAPEVALAGEPPVALLVGSEAHGLAPDLVAGADRSVTIPMVHAESLNAAIAGSILAFERIRLRTG